MRITRKEPDYKETIVVSDTEEQVEGEGGIEHYLSDRELTPTQSVKSERSWTPGTITRNTDNIIHSISELRQHLSQAQMAQPKETSMADVMKLMLEMRANDKAEQERREIEREERSRIREEEMRRNNERREEDRERREEEIRREAERREERMLLAIKEAQPAVPQTVNLMNHKLPKMEPTDEIEQFVGLFEAALKAAKIPEEQWCSKLHAHINTDTKLKIHDTITNPDATYKDIKDALLGYSNVTFNSAAEKLMTADRGSMYKLPIRQFVDKMERYMEKLTKEAATEREIYQYLAVAHARSHLNSKLKAHFEFKGEFGKEQFCRLVEEWQTNQPIGVSWHKSSEASGSSDSKPTFRNNSSKKPGSCFHCGKAGHFSRECRSRIAQERTLQQTPIPSPTPVVKSEPTDTTNMGRDKREITCFNCRQKGHKSPQCPLKTNQVRRINIPVNKVVPLKRNELFGAIGSHRLPITCDTGADVTVIPEECVRKDQLTGEDCELSAFNKTKSKGKWCNVQITIADKVFYRKAVTQPGEALAWTACMSLDFAEQEECDFITQEMRKKATLSEQETLYLPPEPKEGALLSGILASEGNLVEGGEQVVPQEDVTANEVAEREKQPLPATQVEAEKVDIVPVQESEVESMREVSREVLENEQKPLVLVEEVGESLGGSAELREKETLTVEGMKANIPQTELAQATKQDVTLSHLYKLAKLDKEGYHLTNDILFRSRLDPFGQTKEQLCLPKQYRQQCLTLAHNNFGHQGRTKMVDIIKPFFYWPNITKDCLQHIRSCIVCQKTDKSMPRQSSMQLREVTTVPFESVAIDLVGPFPTAVGGYKFLLTCIDNATRWPEAIPIRTTTARTIISQLTNIFTRCGFPTVLTSDNGTQFTGTVFQTHGLVFYKVYALSHHRPQPIHGKARLGAYHPGTAAVQGLGAK